MMVVQEELETHSPALDAATYRRLWLEDAHTLGLIAETLADVLGWQAPAAAASDVGSGEREGDWLPDALELADTAAARIVALERAAVLSQTRLPTKTLHSVHYALN